MASSFKLSLPTDIPWKRICVSKDMLDPIPCDAELPPRWRSSLAFYRYDPAEEYQPDEDYLVSYVKAVVTVAPFAPEISVERASKYVPPMLIDDLEEAFPCYGALLHVTVSPPKSDLTRFSKEQYPHFIDFEPKKRELYEAVTDTGEVLSGSSTSLSVGKGATTTDTTENYNLDTGWNFGLNASYAGTGGGFNVGESGQVGTIDRSNMQRTDIRTSDLSTERRERQSHTTQLSQMYNLFQAFHLGTNRALFFMEPRPHIRQSEATFINGPRALEGLQEIFLTVVRPKNMDDFCLSAVLETAHLTKEPVYEDVTDTKIINFRLYAQAQNKDTTWGETDWTEAVSKTETWSPAADSQWGPDWEIDLSRSGGYDYEILRQQRRQRGPEFTVTPSTISVFGEVTWRFWETGFWNDDNYQDGYLDVDVTVYLKKKEQQLVEIVDKLFLSARDLCCCKDPSSTPVVRIDTWISYIGKLPLGTGVPIHHGFGNRKVFAQSRRLADAIRSEMIHSNQSNRRLLPGKLTYAESDLFFSRVGAILRANRLYPDLFRPVEKTTVMPQADRERIHKLLSSTSLGDILTMDAVSLGRGLGVSREEAVAIKERTLSAIAQQPIDTKSYPEKPGTPNIPSDTDISESERQAVEKQLRLLKDLYQKELLSKEQYEACVKEVLKDILD